MKAVKNSKFYLSVLVLVLGCIVAGQVWGKGSKYSYEDIIRLEKVVNKISEFYVEEIDSEDLVESAIEGLRTVLDPHTAYFTEKDYTNLRVSTEGKFGGLGITIAIRDKILTIISPLQGTPAFRMGLQAGDKILEIEGKSTKGITIEGAVEQLRGVPGTKVTIKVYRIGVAESMEFTVVRDIIRIKSVPFATIIKDGVGYVKVTQFSKNTTQDLETKIKNLKKQGLTSLILDLRNNPGGLLNQAIDVSSLFLDKGQLVVYTQGRTMQQNRKYHSRRKGLWNKDHRLVVLVNAGSASASEIVAGAVQDHDRGLIMGKPSFGKGSVQTILPLDAQKYALKLTTAYYYTPSGRCINKAENAVRSNNKKAETDSLGKDSTKFFLTDSGRKMYAAGGITPDVSIDGRMYARYIREMERKTMFFQYVVKNRLKIEKAGKVTQNYKVSKKMLKNFKNYVYADTSFVKFKSASHMVLEDFGSTLKKERKALGDTVETAKSKEIDTLNKKLAKLLEANTKLEFGRNEEYIKYGLKRELLKAVLGDSAQYVHELTLDKQVIEAMEYLTDEKKYAKAFHLSKVEEKKSVKKKKK